MRIGINLLFLLPGVVGGTETYALSLLKAIGRIDRQNEYLIFLNRESAGLELPVQPNFKRVVCPVPAKFRALRYLWEQFVLPLQARKYRLNLLHSLGYVQPLHLPCPSIVTIHDLNFYNLRPFFSPVKRIALQFFVTHSAKAADHILTVSEFSKKQIVEVLEVSPEKVSVIYNAPKERPAHQVELEELERRYGVKVLYIFALSSPSPHKNITNLIKAFNLLKERGAKELKLVLAGHLPQDSGEVYTLVQHSRFNNDIILTGYVPDEVLAGLYANAKAFAFPSLYEGFGIPILEAFQYGTPVACSNIAALPEIAGDAVLYFDPTDVKEMAEVISRLLNNESECRSLIAKGKQRVAQFTWEEAACKTLGVYRQVICNQ